MRAELAAAELLVGCLLPPGPGGVRFGGLNSPRGFVFQGGLHVLRVCLATASRGGGIYQVLEVDGEG